MFRIVIAVVLLALGIGHVLGPLPVTSMIGAVIVDAAVLAAILLFHWVPSNLSA